MDNPIEAVESKVVDISVAKRGNIKPKENSKNPDKDECLTPSYAVSPLKQILKVHPDMVLWEPCYVKGSGMVEGIEEVFNDNEIIGSHIGHGHDFFKMRDYIDSQNIQANNLGIITNPPYSNKLNWIKQAYQYTNNWAMLLPVESLASSKIRAVLNEKGGASALFLDTRVDFKLPDKTWYESSAQFPTFWLIAGFGVEPNQIYDGYIGNQKRSFKQFCKMIGI